MGQRGVLPCSAHSPVGGEHLHGPLPAKINYVMSQASFAKVLCGSDAMDQASRDERPESNGLCASGLLS